LSWPCNSGECLCTSIFLNCRAILRVKRTQVLYAKFKTQMFGNCSSKISWPLKKGLIGFPETSVRNCLYTLHKTPEDHRSHRIPNLAHHAFSLFLKYWKIQTEIQNYRNEFRNYSNPGTCNTKSYFHDRTSLEFDLHQKLYETGQTHYFSSPQFLPGFGEAYCLPRRGWRPLELSS
jgi:hypothetical protein